MLTYSNEFVSVDSNVKNEMSSDMTSKESTSSSIESSHLNYNHNNNNEIKSGFDKRSEHSPLKHSTNLSDKGLSGMSSLFDNRSNGVIMKCNSLFPKSKAIKPNSLSLKSDVTNIIDSNERTNVSDFSILKTLRKGGFV